MKNLLFGIVTILFMMFGCSDIPTEPTIPYQSGEVKSSDRDDKSRDLSVVRLKGESGVEESQFDANGKRSPNIKAGMSFEVYRSIESSDPHLKVNFILPLESGINTKRQYYLEVFFLKPEIKAMKLLKFFLDKNHDSSHYQTKSDQWSITTHCSVAGSELKKSRGVNGEPRSFSCDFGADVMSSTTGYYAKRFTSEEKSQVAKKQFKSVLLVLHEKSQTNVGLESAKQDMWSAYYTSSSDTIVDSNFPGATERYPQRYGYRCLLDKKGSSDPQSKVVYKHCRYPKSKGGSS